SSQQPRVVVAGAEAGTGAEGTASNGTVTPPRTNDEIRMTKEIQMTKPEIANAPCAFSHSSFGFPSSLVIRPLSFIRHLFLLLVLFAATTCWQVAASELETAFDQANKLFERGKYSEAAAAYEKLVTPGHVSPALYFNLGNAYFKAGQPGH